MKFIQTPVKGMQDFLPSDMQLRQHVLSTIRRTYAQFGFNEIETPMMAGLRLTGAHWRADFLLTGSGISGKRMTLPSNERAC